MVPSNATFEQIDNNEKLLWLEEEGAEASVRVDIYKKKLVLVR